MKTIIVTGGAGYIGSHFINKTLKDQGGEYKIIVVDNFSQGRKNIITNDLVEYHEVDVTDYHKLEDVFQKNTVEAVVHFAALGNVPYSVSNPEVYYTNNIIGGLNVLRCMREHGVDKIIFSSSAAVYGEPVTEVITEEHPKNPKNPYGYTKLVFENILQHYHRAYGIKSISFRYFCAAGSDQALTIGEHHTPEDHVIPSIILTLLGKRESFSVCGNDYPTPDGTGIRDYIHVNDIASAHLLALKKLSEGANFAEVYNLGINKGFSVMELVTMAEKVSGQKLQYAFKDRRPGDPARLIADASKAMKDLGWQPEILSTEEIIGTAYNFFKSQSN